MRHYILADDDLIHIDRRRRPENRIGFALQLCALRYPGRVIRPGEAVPERIVAPLCEQLDLDASVVGLYAARAPTRYEHLDGIRTAFGLRGFTQPEFRKMSGWLLPVALATTRGEAVVEALLSKLRRRGVAAPGPSVIEKLASTAMLPAANDPEVAATHREFYDFINDFAPTTSHTASLHINRKTMGKSCRRYESAKHKH